MIQFARYAIFFAPEPGPFASAAAAWLGWDPATGEAVPHPDAPGLPLPVSDITSTPRKYGFHGTIKPPFRLADGRNADDLASALDALCRTAKSVELNGLQVTRIGHFLALTPVGDQTALADLAARCVCELDLFRAPPSEAELARRRRAGLTERQEVLLAEWGYPYVMDQFRFHLTLSGALTEDVIAPIAAALAERFDPLVQKPFVIGSLCLFGESEDGRFRLIQRHCLAGDPNTP